MKQASFASDLFQAGDITQVLLVALVLLITALVLTVFILQIAWRPNRESAEVLRTLGPRVDKLQTAQLRFEEQLRAELGQSRQEMGNQTRDSRTELLRMVQSFGDSSAKRLNDSQDLLQRCLTSFQTGNENKLERIRETVESKLSELRTDNAKQLEAMRCTVDEKLQRTLNLRLGESFKLVSDRLDQVHQGLGEMQTLAAGVGDLKKVLTNVKTRGGWGEMQLGALLEQMLAPSQFSKNERIRADSAESVEYVIKLPGNGADKDFPVLLPVDSKFPMEDYERLIKAQESTDLSAVEESTKALRLRIIQSARDIKEKYLNPPITTDFGIMFLPAEGLFAEVMRQPGLVEELQNKHRVVVAGPTTFWALLNSLQMGFRTLAIQKQSSEVWKTLGEVKTEFNKFEELVEAVKKKLHEASNKMDDVGQRSRAVARRLRGVAELPLPDMRNGSDLVPVTEAELITSNEE